MLIRLTGARRAIEVGTFTGYSSLAIASALPAGGLLICCDVSDEWTRIGKPYWDRAGVAAKIELVIAPATATLDARLARGEAGAWDFAFIDADKPNYINYYERCLKLLRAGGLIVFDNTLWSGAVADASDQTESTVALRELNDKLHHDERVAVSLLSIGDGVTLALKR
jgi:predicted O-methyltransferase YrrM